MTDESTAGEVQAEVSRNDGTEPYVTASREHAVHFRADIEGLRGVAVVAVVLFHARVAGFSGGFVGVDVFFVLSGFLITGILVDERARYGRVSFGRFYTRRIRRLVPASVLVFVTTIVMVNRWLSPLDAAELGRQAPWVALFGSNIWFSNHATDYLQPDVVSPFQQYWSLAVEEQFYLVWPLLVLILSFRVIDRQRLLRRLSVGLGAAVVASFVLAVQLVGIRQPSAFFLLPPRAWELAIGGLLAIHVRSRAARSGEVVPQRIRSLIALGGLSAVLVPVVVYGSSTKFPGITALPPVLGTVAILWAGASRLKGPDDSAGAGASDSAQDPLLNRWLATRGLRLVGRYSYSLYLWHWPLLVIPEAAAGRPLNVMERTGLVVIAAVASVITFHVVENPLRYMPVLALSKAWSLLLGISLICLALASSTTLPRAGYSNDVLDRLADLLPPDLAKAVATAPGDRGEGIERGCHGEAEDDLDANPVDPVKCMFGAVEDRSAPLVMLLGDSHAMSWHPAIEKIAENLGWRLVTLTKSSCPLVPIPVFLERSNSHYDGCDAWRVQVNSSIKELDPELIVLGNMSSHYAYDPTQAGEQAWLEALSIAVSDLVAEAPVVVLEDVPVAPESIPQCILRSKGRPATCDFHQSDQERSLSDAERERTQDNGGIYLETVSMTCPGGRCQSAKGNIVTYTDKSHMTATFSESLAGSLAELLKPAVRQ